MPPSCVRNVVTVYLVRERIGAMSKRKLEVKEHNGQLQTIEKNAVGWTFCDFSSRWQPPRK